MFLYRSPIESVNLYDVSEDDQRFLLGRVMGDVEAAGPLA